jgi:hypothetical protein
MFDTLGDRIALQYGGSEANKKVAKQYRKESGPDVSGAIGMHEASTGAAGGGSAQGSQTAYVHSGAGGAEFLTSLKRYYNNVTKDALKQVRFRVFDSPDHAMVSFIVID